MDHTECFVSGTFGTLLRFSRFSGTAPFRFVKDGKGWRVSISSTISYIGYFVMALSKVIIIWNLVAKTIIRDKSHVQAWKGTHKVIWHSQVLMMTALASMMVYNAPKRMRFLMVCLNQVEKINLSMDIRYWPVKYKKKYVGLFILRVIVIVTVTVIDYVALFTFVGPPTSEVLSIMTFLLYRVYYSVIQLGITQFVLEVLQVRSNFKAVNDSLRNLLQEDNRIRILNHEVEVVRRISFAYMSACGVVRDVDRFHGLELLMLLSSSLVFLVITPYYFINSLVADLGDQNPARHNTYLLVQCIWCILHLTALMITIEPCHLTHVEMKITRELIGRLLRRTGSIRNPLTAELDHFLKLITLNEVAYEPLMMTSLTRNLVVQILGSITTYLTIIVEI